MKFPLRFTGGGFMLSVLFLIPVISPIYDLSAQAQDAVISDAHVTFTTIDVPGAIATNVNGINTAGDMVGIYTTTDGSTSSFLLSESNFTIFNYPGGDSTAATGINDSGTIVGWAYTNNFTGAVGFIYDGTTFTTLQVPGKSATIGDGINNAGEIVGGDGSLAATKGFVSIGARFRNVSPPGNYIYVYATGINNFGEIVGWTTGQTGGGFINRGGNFKTLRVPGATQTEAWDVNDGAIVVGWYSSGPGFSGFVLKDGRYLSLRYPGAQGTFALGINNGGQVVGSYEDQSGVFHGFVTSPVTTADFPPVGSK